MILEQLWTEKIHGTIRCPRLIALLSKTVVDRLFSPRPFKGKSHSTAEEHSKL